MCAEKRPEGCHRTRLIGATLDDMGIPLRHIDEAGEARSQAEVVERLRKAQGELFDG